MNKMSTSNKDSSGSDSPGRKFGLGWTDLGIKHGLALMLDTGFAFSLYTYYSVISSFPATSIETLVRQATEGAAMQAWSMSLAVILFLILPTCIYTLFKSLKIPVLAKGSVGAMPGLSRMFFVNLGFLIGSFVVYGLFELLGAAVQEAYMPVVAGLFLVVVMGWLGIVVCVSHQNLYQSRQTWVRSAFTDWAALKRGILFFAGGVGLLVVINSGAYMLATPGSDKPFEYLTYAIGAMLFILSNQFQLGLYENKPSPSYPSTTK